MFFTQKIIFLLFIVSKFIEKYYKIRNKLDKHFHLYYNVWQQGVEVRKQLYIFQKEFFVL